MTQKIELEKMGIFEMDFGELQYTDGGSSPDSRWCLSPKGFLYYVWYEFLDGFEDGSGAK